MTATPARTSVCFVYLSLSDLIPVAGGLVLLREKLQILPFPKNTPQSIGRKKAREKDMGIWQFLHVDLFSLVFPAPSGGTTESQTAWHEGGAPEDFC